MNLVSQWQSVLRSEFSQYSFGTFQKDFLTGLTVAAVALPLALAFGVAAGAGAAAGLVTAVVAGILVGFLGGAPYMVSGPTGAIATVLIVLSNQYGLQGVWLASIMAGIILILLGIFRLGRFVKLIPSPVISGFVSGIAVIIALGQIDNALGIQTPAAETFIQKLSYYFQNGVSPNWTVVAITALVIAIMLVWPRVPFSERVPGSLVGIVVATLLAILTSWDIPAIGSIPRSILLEDRLSLFDIPWGDLGGLIAPAIAIAALAGIESLLVGAVGGNMTGVRLNNSVELVAQGIGNLVFPFFGGVPGSAAIARTSVNIKSGGVTRLVTMVHGLALMMTALVFAPWISQVPLAALAGVLLVTAWRMNEWGALNIYFGKRIKHAMAIFLITLFSTVLLDLTQAIVIGCVLSLIIFVAQNWSIRKEGRSTFGIQINEPEKEKSEADAAHVYEVDGALYFGTARQLLEEVETQAPSNTDLVLGMQDVHHIDITGLDVLQKILERQEKEESALRLVGVQPQVQTFLERSGFLEEIGPTQITQV